MVIGQGAVVQSALLRSELVRLRKSSGLTQEQVAGFLEWSPSKLIRVEGGRSSITKVDLDALLTRYKVTSESHRERLHAMNREARTRGWWDRYRENISPAYLNYVGFEAGASFIRHFQLGFVPGLLQTAEYARAVTVGSVKPDDVDSVVRLRLQRQSELAQRQRQPRQYYVVDEGAIRRRVGKAERPEIMPNQLRDLADKAEQDELVTIRIIPFEAGAHPGLFDGPFTLLEFEGGLPDALYLDVGRGLSTLITGNDPQVKAYTEDFDNLLEIALPAEASIELIRSVAESMH